MAVPPDGPEPAGVDRCASCAYVTTGTAQLCLTCARDRTARVAPHRSVSSDPTLHACGQWGSPLWGWPIGARGWDFLWAIAMRAGRLKGAMADDKYDDRKGWAWIFGRFSV